MVTIPGTGVHLGLPPRPWPFGGFPDVKPLQDLLPTVPAVVQPDSYPRPPWAPAGDRYVFTLGMYLDRCLQQSSGGVVRSRRQLAALIEAVFPDAGDLGPVALESGSGALAPALQALPATMEVPHVSFDYLVAQVHAKLGILEEVSHSFALVHTGASPQPDDLTEAELAAVAGQVRDAWAAFFVPLAGNFGSDLHYDYVKVSKKRQTGALPASGSAKGLVKNVGDPAEVGFAPNVRGTQQVTLPYAVALVLSLGTQRKGGRYRGRTYLGGLTTLMMDGGGNNPGCYAPGNVLPIAQGFGAHFIAGMAATDWHVNVWSGRSNAGREVASVSVGQVPDTMRSRRKSQQENLQLGWGTL